jgi:hypothetical protein
MQGKDSEGIGHGYFDVLSWHSQGMNKEIYEKCHEGLCFVHGLPEYKTEVLVLG